MSSIDVQTLTARLADLCVRHAMPFPGGDELLARLRSLPRHAQAPAPLRLRLAQAVAQAWVRGVDEPQDWAMQALVDALDLAWEGMDVTERLATGLVPPWARAQGALAQAGALVPMAEALCSLSPQTPQRDLALMVLLRQARSLKQVPMALRLLAQWRALPALSNEQLGVVGTTVAMIANNATELDELRPVTAWVDRLLPLLLDPKGPADRWAAWGRGLCRAAIGTMDLLAMQRLSGALLALDPMPETLDEPLGHMLQHLAHYATEDAPALIELAAQRMPWHPGIQMEWMKLREAAGAFARDLIHVLPQLDVQHPMYVYCVRLLADYCFRDSELDAARECYRCLQAVEGGMDAHAGMRLSHLNLRDAEGESASSAVAAEFSSGRPQALLDLVRLAPGGAVTLALGDLAEALTRSPRYDAAQSVAELEALCDAACERFIRQLQGHPEVTLEQALLVADELWTLSQSGHLALAHWLGAFPYDMGPDYGVFDVMRSRALCFGVLRHLVALSRHMVGRRDTLVGGSSQAGMNRLLDLVGLGARAAVLMRDVPLALQDLGAARARLGPLGGLHVEHLIERSLLSTGQLTAALDLRASWAHRAPADVLPMLEWPEWVRAEGLQAQTIVNDPELHGQFEVVRFEGELRGAAHHTVAVDLEVVRVQGVQVRNSHLLIGPAGHLMLPHPWHLQIGEFPYRHATVLTRGKTGAALSRPAAWQRVTEPVALLANMDAGYHRNFYHWVVQALTRIEVLRREGLLDGRRLLIPAELPGWMFSSLRDIGLPESALLRYGPDECLTLDDALVISPTEFASPTPNEALRDRLWRAAGLDPLNPPPQDRLLFISRPSAHRRPLMHERQICAMAESLGFEVVAPEVMSLLDQVRLFAGAKAVVGPSGAALTNLMWTGDDVRVLFLFKEEASVPTFIDLSLIRRQQYRWLQGRNTPGFERMTIVFSPFFMNMAEIENQLCWACGRESGARMGP